MGTLDVFEPLDDVVRSKAYFTASSSALTTFIRLVLLSMSNLGSISNYDLQDMVARLVIM